MPPTQNFNLIPGDFTFLPESIKFDNSDLVVKKGSYKLVEIELHPKASPEEVDNLKSYCYSFRRVKDDGCLSSGSGFRYNCLKFDELIAQRKVIVPLNKDKFVKDLRSLLAKHQVSLSAGWDFDGPWDEVGYVSIFVNSHDFLGHSCRLSPKQHALGRILCPPSPESPPPK